MKLRRRDPHHLSIVEGYYSLKHDGSDKELKKIRTIASMHTLNSQSVLGKRHNNNSQPNKSRKLQPKQPRLRRVSKKHQSNKNLTLTGDIINANSFKHLTAVHYMDTAQIKWALGLRNHQPSSIPRSTSQVPSTYYKTTQSSKVKHFLAQVHHQTSQIPSRLNYNTFMHLTRSGQHPSMGTLQFQMTLREKSEEGRSKSPELLEKEKCFQTIPVKDRNQYPKLLNSLSIKKKTINPEEDLRSALDGNNNFPAYNNGIIRQKNYANLREYLARPKRGKINLPSLGWQTGLRFYQAQLASSPHQNQQPPKNNVN